MGIIAKIKNLIAIDLVKVSGLNAGLILLRMAMSLGLSKFLALTVGPSGLALIGQLTNAVQAMVATGTLASGQAVTKYTAEYKGGTDTYLAFIISTTKAVLIASLSIAFFSFFFANWLSSAVFDTPEYASIFRIFSFNISLFAINGLLLAIINGKKLVKKYIYVNVVATLATTALTIGLILALGIYGGLISYVIAQSVILIYTLYAVRDEVILIFSNFRKYKLNPKWLKLLLTFSMMTFVSMFLAPISKVFVRNEIIDNVSLNAAGIWEGMNKITSLYLMFFTSIIPIYYLPRLSALKINSELRKEVYTFLKVVFPFACIAALAVYLLRHLLVRIALSDEFLPMADLFSVQLLGDVFRVISLVFAFALIAKAKVKGFVFIEISVVSMYIILTWFLVGQYGLIGSTWAYTISYGMYALLSYIYFKKNFLGD